MSRVQRQCFLEKHMSLGPMFPCETSKKFERNPRCFLGKHGHDLPMFPKETSAHRSTKHLSKARDGHLRITLIQWVSLPQGQMFPWETCSLSASIPSMFPSATSEKCPSANGGGTHQLALFDGMFPKETSECPYVETIPSLGPIAPVGSYVSSQFSTLRGAHNV